MRLIHKLRVNDTDNSILFNEIYRKYKSMYKLMKEYSPTRKFFLSSIGNAARLEVEPILEDPIKRTLLDHHFPSAKGDKITKTIVTRLRSSILKRRAISVESGLFGTIFPFDPKELDLKVSPSAHHIYGSYFSNYFAVERSVLSSLDTTIKYESLRKVFERLNKKAGNFVEKFYICKTCKKLSLRKLGCGHKLILLRLFKMYDNIIEGWKRGLVLISYVVYNLKRTGWTTIVEKSITGVTGCPHQIDIIAQKGKNVVLIECKHLAINIKVCHKDMFKFLGICGDVEKRIKQLPRSKKHNIFKAYITTSKFDSRLKSLDKRSDIVLIDNKLILEKPERWVRDIEEKIG